MISGEHKQEAAGWVRVAVAEGVCSTQQSETERGEGCLGDQITVSLYSDIYLLYSDVINSFP